MLSGLVSWRSVRLSGTVAMVTGASRGVGRATAAEDVRRLGRRAFVVPTDVAGRDQTKELVPAVLAEWGRVDIVVANARVYIRRPLAELTAEAPRHAAGRAERPVSEARRQLVREVRF